MQAVRAVTVERLAAPRAMGRFVGNVKVTWPLLIGLPILFWVLSLWMIHGNVIPQDPMLEQFGYAHFVPHWLIYSVFFTVFGVAFLTTWISGNRFWRLLGAHTARTGSFLAQVIPILWEIMTHKRFGKCDGGAARRLGHLALFWGFVGAALTSALLIVAMYILKAELPLSQSHPFKILGNLSAVLLVVGGFTLFFTRLRKDKAASASQASDVFFLAIVLMVIVTGVLVETGRFLFEPEVACWFYILHLGSILTLFSTFSYSKFAHLLYRTLVMIHARMVATQKIAGDSLTKGGIP